MSHFGKILLSLLIVSSSTGCGEAAENKSGRAPRVKS